MRLRRHLTLVIVAGAMAVTGGACNNDDETLDVGTGDTTSTSAGPTTTSTTSAAGPDIAGTVTAVVPFEAVVDDCVEGALDPNSTSSDQDPPVCTPSGSTRAGTVLVEESPGSDTGRKISFTVDGATRVSAAEGSDRTGADGLRSLRVGATVEAWVAGPCAQSYPEQCAAATIIVVSDDTSDPRDRTGH